MADNVDLTSPAGSAAADEVSDGTLGTVKVQYVKLMDGTLNGTTKGTIDANGLDVDVTRLPALAAGTNNIGDVDVLTVPTDPFGANADAASATGSISAKLRFIASTGIPVTGTVTVGSHAVTNAGTFAVQPAGSVAHDGAASAVNPVLQGGFASAAAPTDVSADTDSVRAWHLRNGAAATVITAAGALIGGDATNGLDVDVTRLPALVAGSALIGKVDVQFAGTVPDTGSGTGGSKTQRVIIDSSQFSTLGQTTKTASAPVTIASDQGYAGNVGGITTLFPVTLSLDTSAYASGDVLADTQVLTSLFRISDGTGVLQSIQVIDQDDQKQAIDFYYLSANNSVGTENSAPNISDANAIEMVGPFSVAAADYKDLGGVSVAKISNIGQPIIAASGTANGYIAAICNSGTPTYTASGIKLRLGILRD